MKIYVDKMPETVANCPWSARRENALGATWYGCNRGSLVCEDVGRCPFFAELPRLRQSDDGYKPNLCIDCSYSRWAIIGGKKLLECDKKYAIVRGEDFACEWFRKY